MLLSHGGDIIKVTLSEPEQLDFAYVYMSSITSSIKDALFQYISKIGKKNPRHPYYMSSNELKSVKVEKDLGIMITSDLKCSQQCEYIYSIANRVMGMRTITYKEPRIMLWTLVRPHVEYCSCAWNPSYKEDKELLEKRQHRFTKMILNMQEKTYEERLKLLGLWTLEERQNRILWRFLKCIVDIALSHCRNCLR